MPCQLHTGMLTDGAGTVNFVLISISSGANKRGRFLRRSFCIDAGFVFVFVLALPFLVLFIRPPLTNFWPVMVAWFFAGGWI